MARVTLSIDNGPDPERTPLALDVLRRRQVSASFFVLGRLLAEPENLRLAERARADHTWSHQVPFGSNDAPDAIERELEATERLIGPLAHRKRWFRPFGSGGALDARLLSIALVDHLVAHR